MTDPIHKIVGVDAHIDLMKSVSPRKEKKLKIDAIKINGFGKLKEKEIEFKDGINVVYGENEAGKSTLLKCIQSMFYGVSKLKNGKSISDFDQYKPWEDAAFSGKIKYTLDNGEQYEVFRDFKKKSPVIYNEFQEDISKNFKVDKAKGINFLEEQVGVDETSFKNTAMICQQEVKLERADTNVIVQKISNLVSTGDDNISFQKAMDKLNKMQNDCVGTQRTRQKPINLMDEEIERLLQEKRRLSGYKESQMKHAREKETLSRRLNELFEKKANLKEKQKNSENVEMEDAKKKVNIYTYVLLFFVIVCVLMFAVVRNVVAEIVSIVPIVVVAILMKRKSNAQFESLKKANQEWMKKCEMEQESVQNEINQANVELHILENEKNDMDEKLEELARIEEKLDEQNAMKAELLSLDISFQIAREALEKAYEEMKHNISPKFEQNLCEMIGEITDKKYTKVKMNDETGLLVEVENGEYMPAQRLSVGTIDEMYLALRLSTLSEISKENLPILFDETFAYFDENRLKNMLYYLQDRNYNHQIMIFTCSNREEEMLKQLKIEYNRINLEGSNIK